MQVHSGISRKYLGKSTEWCHLNGRFLCISSKLDIFTKQTSALLSIKQNDTSLGAVMAEITYFTVLSILQRYSLLRK